MTEIVKVTILLRHYQTDAVVEQNWRIDISKVSAISEMNDTDGGNCLVDGCTVIIKKGHGALKRAFDKYQKNRT